MSIDVGREIATYPRHALDGMGTAFQPGPERVQGRQEGVAAALSGRNRAGLGQSGCVPGALGASVFPVWGMSSRAVELCGHGKR